MLWIKIDFFITFTTHYQHETLNLWAKKPNRKTSKTLTLAATRQTLIPDRVSCIPIRGVPDPIASARDPSQLSTQLTSASARIPDGPCSRSDVRDSTHSSSRLRSTSIRACPARSQHASDDQGLPDQLVSSSRSFLFVLQLAVHPSWWSSFNNNLG